MDFYTLSSCTAYKTKASSVPGDRTVPMAKVGSRTPEVLAEPLLDFLEA